VISTYTILKFLHILAAIAWVGSGIFMQAYATTAIRDGSDAELGYFAKRVGRLGLRVITPASILVLLLGVALVAESDVWAFTDLWIVLALIGYAITALTGAMLIGPEAERIGALVDAQGADSPEARRRIRRIFRISRIDLLVIVLIVLDMVVKPGA
jgi:uncharacterized membrane protein